MYNGKIGYIITGPKGVYYYDFSEQKTKYIDIKDLLKKTTYRYVKNDPHRTTIIYYAKEQAETVRKYIKNDCRCKDDLIIFPYKIGMDPYKELKDTPEEIREGE